MQAWIELHRDKLVADWELSRCPRCGPSPVRWPVRAARHAVAGVLSDRALRTARSENGDAEQWVEQLFGPRWRALRIKGNARLAPRGFAFLKVCVEEGKRQRTSRVRIDRFIQGVMPAALFDEEPGFGGHVRLRLELRDPAPGSVDCSSSF